MSRHYRTSSPRRRRGGRWRWLVLVLLLAGGGWYLFSGGDDEGAEPAEPTVADASGEAEVAERQPAAVNERSSSGQAAGTRSTPRVSEMSPVVSVDSSATRSRNTTAAADANDNQAGSTPSRQTSRPSSGSSSRDSGSSATSPSRSRATTRSQGSSRTPSIESAEIRAGMALIADGDVIKGREVLSALLFDDRRRLSTSDARAIRETLASINDRLVFSPDVMADDPVAERYQVQSGDLLVRIARRYKLTYPFLEQINGIDASRLQVGQSIKLIRGPFHVRVSKSEYRMDVFVRQSDGSPIYIRSFPVGLGEEDSTPEGMWVIEPNRKVVNPSWRNPRTGEFYEADDPKNPIGDYWLAMEGIDSNTANQRGYGIHGTIEPDSIGQSASMGCIRLLDDDIEQVYHLLVEGESTVEVVR